jgi:hypothetical protein
MKKIIYVILAFVLLGLAVYFIFFSKLTYSSATKLEWSGSVPGNVSWVAIINKPISLSQIIDSVEYGENLKTISFIDELIAFKSAMDSFQIKEGFFQKSISGPVYASYHLAGVGKMEPIIYIPTNFKYKKLVKKMEELKASTSSVDEIWEYKGMKLFGYNDFESKQKIFFTLAGGNFIISKVAFLVEDAVSAISDGLKSPLSGEISNVFSDKPSNSDIQLIFNFSNANLFLSTIISPDFLSSFAKSGEWGNWAVLDFYLNENGLFYTGNIYSENKGISSYTGNLENPTMVLPNNTAFYFSKNIEFSYSKNPDIKSSFSSLLSGTLVDVTTELYDESFDKYNHHLLSLKENFDLQLLRGFTESDMEDNKVYSCNSKGRNLFSTLLSYEQVPENVYICKLSNWLVVSKNETSIELIKDKFLRNEVLKRDISFNELNDQLKEEGNSSLYFNIKNNKLLLSNASSIYVKKDFDSLYNALTNFNQGMVHFKKGSSSTTVMGYVLQTETSPYDNQLVWKTKLEAKANRVQVVKADDGRYIVLAQDSLNILYALSTGGNVLWKKNLESKIVGNIYDADFLNNGNRHYIFNTHKKIYRIDESGNDMNEFPIKLPDSTNQPLVIFKNLKDKFMMFVQAGNGNLHGYEVTGKPLSGWNPVANIKPLKNKVRFFVEGGKGYIAAFCEDNRMHVFAENGTRAFPATKIEGEYYSPFSVDISIAPLKLKNITTQGKVYSITNKGQVNSAQLNFSHPIHFYTLKDVIRDKDPEIVVAGENCVSIYTKTGDKIQTFCFESDNKEFEYQFIEKGKVNESNYLLATSKQSCISYLIRLSNNMVIENVKPIPICGEVILSKLFDTADNFLLTTGTGEIQVYRVQ